MTLASPPVGAKPKAIKVPWGSTTTSTSIDYRGLNVFWAEYRRESLVRQCLNILAYFTVHTGFRVSVRGRRTSNFAKYVEQKLIDINLSDAIYVGLIGKKIWGHFGFEIVRTAKKEIVQLLPLFPPERLVPVIDANNVLTGFEFTPSGASSPIKYKPNEILYFIETSFDSGMGGLSAIEPIVNPCALKRELYDDLREAAKRLWAPIGVFSMDTTALKTAKEVENALNEFKDQMEPGKPVVTNQSVTGQFFNAMPDVERIVRAIEKVDEEIMGNFGIPKALVARERTMNRATLEYSLQALYQSQVEGLQQYMAREIQLQLLNLLKDEYHDGNKDDIVVEIIWNPRTSLELDRQFTPAFTLYALGIIDVDYLYDLLSLDKNRMPEYMKKPIEGYEGGPRFDPDTMRAALSQKMEKSAEEVKEHISSILAESKGEF